MSQRQRLGSVTVPDWSSPRPSWSSGRTEIGFGAPLSRAVLAGVAVGA